MTKLKPKWWCIRKECKHYKQYHCYHPAFSERWEFLKKVRIKELKMCPILADIGACIGLT